MHQKIMWHQSAQPLEVLAPCPMHPPGCFLACRNFLLVAVSCLLQLRIASITWHPQLGACEHGVYD